MKTSQLAITTAICALAHCSVANAIPLECAEDKTTNGMFCFSPTELREADGIRTAPLYVGGPKAVDRTAYTIAANCATGVMHLKDRQGVSFGGSGPGEGTPQSRQLRRIVCDAQVPVAKKKR